MSEILSTPRDDAPPRPPEPMDAETYLAWAVDAEIRAELYNGRVVMMAPERASHAVAKRNVFRQFDRQLQNGPCEAWLDGMAIRIGDATVFEPDLFVRCGDPAPGDTLAFDDPALIVEIASPSTSGVDATKKLLANCELPSLQRYVRILLDDRKAVAHWRREADSLIAIEHWTAERGPVALPLGNGRSVTLDLAETLAEAERWRAKPASGGV